MGIQGSFCALTHRLNVPDLLMLVVSTLVGVVKKTSQSAG
jgi:hypothetical protein